MTDIELLNWARGPAFQYATVIFVLGVILRILEILLLGRHKDLAEARGSAMIGGLRTIFTRSVPDAGTFRRATLPIIAGYLFHIGLLVTIFFYAPHILFFREVSGLTWSSLPSNAIDAVVVITMITMIVVLIHRVVDPVKRFLSTIRDYLVWFVTFLPLVTGYLAFHRLGTTPQMMIALHILSVELLMVVFPFTKLMHAFTLFTSRWYNGAAAGYKGVSS